MKKLNDEQNCTKTDSLDEVDAYIIQRLLQSPAVTDNELAEGLGVSRQTVNRRRSSVSVRGAIKEKLSLSEHEVRRIAYKSFQRLEALIDHEDPRIQLAASSLFLRLASKLVTAAGPFEYDSMDFRL